MSSEIGNKALLRSVADFLEILDVKQFASRLKTDEVIPVIDIGNVGDNVPIPAYNEYSVVTAEANTLFDTDYNWQVVAADPLHDHRLAALNFYIQRDGSPGIYTLGVFSTLAFDETAVHPFDYACWDKTPAAVGPGTLWIRRFSLWGCNSLFDASAVPGIISNACTWDGFIPAGYPFSVHFRTNAPALGATLIAKAMLYKVPKGRLAL